MLSCTLLALAFEFCILPFVTMLHFPWLPDISHLYICATPRTIIGVDIITFSSPHLFWAKIWENAANLSSKNPAAGNITRSLTRWSHKLVTSKISRKLSSNKNELLREVLYPVTCTSIFLKNTCIIVKIQYDCVINEEEFDRMNLCMTAGALKIMCAFVPWNANALIPRATLFSVVEDAWACSLKMLKSLLPPFSPLLLFDE